MGENDGKNFPRHLIAADRSLARHEPVRRWSWIRTPTCDRHDNLRQNLDRIADVKEKKPRICREADANWL